MTRCRVRHAARAACALVLAAIVWSRAFAEEGMWRPSQLPQLASTLERAGLRLDPATLTELTEHPLGAVIDLGGCSASFVSPDGLIITNHHCAEGDLQYHSTSERNLLEQGFLADGRAGELPASPGKRVRVTVGVRDVTAEIMVGLDHVADPAERYRTYEAREKALVARCEEKVGSRCSVRSFLGGLEHLLIEQLELRDVRLVYAPPSSIGVFGGEVDNWMWPRHTGDFAFLRAWVGPGGEPADPAPENVPYRPKHWLEVAAAGVREGDFVMVVGYPGSTGRHRLAIEAENAFTWFYPYSKTLGAELIALIERRAEAVPEAEILYATTVSGLSNASKNYEGMLDGFARSDMLERKRERERELAAWSAARGTGAAEAFTRLESLVERDQVNQERDRLLGMMDRLTLLGTARRLYRLAHERQLPDAEREPGYQERDIDRFEQALRRLERRFHSEVDRAILAALLERWARLPSDQRIAELDQAVGLEPGVGASAEKLAALYAGTHLGDLERRILWMEATPEALEAAGDPFLALASAMWAGDRARELEAERLEGELLLARRDAMRALTEFLAARGEPVYPDANGSLRVTYGAVRGYSPRDGVYYLPFTSLEGIAAKHSGEEPFDAPARELERIAARDHGAFRLESIGSVPVNFLSTVDTTGGNSGSPTLDGDGRLVGLLFDGTWDSINSDWDFDERTTRSIHADIRYALWVMDRVDGAHALLRELGVGVEPSPAGAANARSGP